MARYAFYSTGKWQRISRYVIDRAGGICERCGKARAEIAHHIIWVDDSNYKDPMIIYNLHNLQAVCRDCHTIIHNPNSVNCRDGYYLDDDGILQKK